MQQHSRWKQQEEEEEDEPMTEHVPLHLAERNLLSHHNTFKTTGKTKDVIVMFTIKENDAIKDMVLFPSPQKVEALEKSRECTEDKRPSTLEALQKITKRATAIAKRETLIKKATSAQAQPSALSATSGKQQVKTQGKDKTNSTVKTNSLPEITGYLDTYNWDHYHSLDPHFTFSRARHNQRMARLAEMAEFGTPLPLTGINIPLQMDEYELFDQTGDP